MQTLDPCTHTQQKDKYENEDLIRYGLPEDVWWHVDNLSSAHVYLRQKPGEKLDDISPQLLLECAALVKVRCKASKQAGCIGLSLITGFCSMRDGHVGLERLLFVDGYPTACVAFLASATQHRPTRSRAAR